MKAKLSCQEKLLVLKTQDDGHLNKQLCCVLCWNFNVTNFNTKPTQLSYNGTREIRIHSLRNPVKGNSQNVVWLASRKQHAQFKNLPFVEGMACVWQRWHDPKLTYSAADLGNEIFVLAWILLFTCWEQMASSMTFFPRQVSSDWSRADGSGGSKI